MVSVYPNPPPDQDFCGFHGLQMGGDLIKLPGMETDGGNLPHTAPVGNVASAVEDASKKIRKPYTITKSRESWSEQEHDKFLEALHLFDRDWKKIEAYVGSKTVIQIRSHAQKYFLKVQKNGTSEHVPPPRPKRKAAHPYPQKAPKNAAGAQQSSTARLESGYVLGPDSLSIPENQMASAPLPWTYNAVPPVCLTPIQKGDIGFSSFANTYSSSSNESNPRVWTPDKAHSERKARRCNSTRVMPDFAQVYGFIGSVFDPTASDHLRRLREMDPLNVETVLMLMKNLTVNLMSPEFENHRKLLSSGNSTGDKHMPVPTT
ncbi:protein REVEILLE 6-like [Andrographis paniculata]|uniref:protein REVEILLE 6-like n=1 Tax=Andrographis paniculata TaxID=175694 RepID=UPI0021E7402D|nr:protein REVEILLE 6-like [Andrographis paniculata]